jgi:D-beta-D-heptose 7-phosphate kinase/D-beta-D-heptose 1-phosphate adenosyltransferase
MTENIVLDYAHLQPILTKLRRQKKKIVLTQGSFDMIHIGHGRYLKEAKGFGDVLIVGTDSDSKIRDRKGKGRPVVPEDERLEMLTYLTPVDYVVLKPHQAPKWSLIKLIKPDVLVATQETYSPEDLEKLKQYCGLVVVLDRMATTSTSAKLRRVQIGEAQKIELKLTKRLIGTIEEVLSEFKQ